MPACASRVHFWAQLELNVACSAKVLRPTQGEGKRERMCEGCMQCQGAAADTGRGIDTVSSDRFSIHD